MLPLATCCQPSSPSSRRRHRNFSATLIPATSYGPANYLRASLMDCRDGTPRAHPVRSHPHTRRCTPMLRKFLYSPLLAGLMLSGIAAHARPPQDKSQTKQRNEDTKSSSGKVTDI